MKFPFKSLKNKLFFWYVTSLVSIVTFFYLAIHLFALEYGNYIFLILILILALEGYYILRKITESLTDLSDKMKSISSTNLDDRITNIEGDDEISELAQTFNDLLDRLNESFKREQQFIGDVAHELKTPLATMRTSAEITLNKDRSAKEYRQAFEESLVDINRLSSTLKNVLDLAWSQSDAAKHTLQTFNLSEVVEELVEIAQKLAITNHIKITSSVKPSVLIQGDKEKISRAILNVIDNAIKYTPSKKQVDIQLKKVGLNAQVIIKDTGIGISSKDAEHIFDRFYRGSKTDKTLGSGLGLAIAQAVIKSHKGEILLKSQVNEGSTFTITLPLKD